MTSDQRYDFAERFQAQSGVAHRVPTQRAAAVKIVSLIHSLGAGCVALAGLPEALTDAIQAGCRNIEVLKEPYDAAGLPGAIDAADIGISGIAFAIAQTGTLAEVSTNDAVRLVSGLPRTYIGVLHDSDIIDKYDDAAARVRSIVARHDQNLVISFISGPSRTGDIELKLTLGVHGPEQAHAVVITEPP